MSHIAFDTIIPNTTYNKFLLDHHATEQAKFRKLKEEYVVSLANVLEKHNVSHYVELHVLHKHFDLEDGEVIMHRELHIPAVDGQQGLVVDIAKAVPYHTTSGKRALVPVLWMASSAGSLVPYEFAAQEGASRKIAQLSTQVWNDFSRDFCNQLKAYGLEDLVSLKDKSCINGAEYVVPGTRALFRVPIHAVTLQSSEPYIETGWTVDVANVPRADPNPMPECTDGHKTKTRQTSGGTVAQYHSTTRWGEDAIGPDEMNPVYTTQIWDAVESAKFFKVLAL